MLHLDHDFDNDLDQCKKHLRFILSTSEEGLPGAQVNAKYKDIAGEGVPYKKFNFRSLKTFLQSIPDVCEIIRVSGGDMMVVGGETSETMERSPLTLSLTTPPTTPPMPTGTVLITSDLDKYKKYLMSILLDNKEGVNGGQLNAKYKDLVGESLPYKMSGSLKTFLQSIPDVCKITTMKGGEMMVVGVDSESDADSDEVEDYLMLSSNKNPVIDIEDDSDTEDSASLQCLLVSSRERATGLYHQNEELRAVLANNALTWLLRPVTPRQSPTLNISQVEVFLRKYYSSPDSDSDEQ